MFTPSAKVRLAVAAALLLAVAVGCEKDRPLITAASPDSAPPGRMQGAMAVVSPPGEPKGDNRSYWTYDGGHFTQGVGEAWFQHSAEVEKTGGKPWEFREVARSKENVELYDASRAVTVRLSSSEAQARWDKDGKDAEWQTLQKGKWGKPE